MAMHRTRLEFFVGEQAVGHFRTRGYPTVPGRYRYSPYRGVGHLRLARALRRGENPICWYKRRRRKVAFVVIHEEFVHDDRRCAWFIDISQIGEQMRP
jgi:hypothetical protein